MTFDDFNTLILSAKNGNDIAKTELISMYNGLILNNARINGKFDEDLKQELYIVFLQCIAKSNINADSNITKAMFTSYFGKASTYKIGKYIDRLALIATWTEETTGDENIVDEKSEVCLEQGLAVIEQIECKKLYDVMKSLSKEKLEILMMKEVQGKTSLEIGAEIGISENAVQKRIAKIKKPISEKKKKK